MSNIVKLESYLPRIIVSILRTILCRSFPNIYAILYEKNAIIIHKELA